MTLCEDGVEPGALFTNKAGAEQRKSPSDTPVPTPRNRAACRQLTLTRIFTLKICAGQKASSEDWKQALVFKDKGVKAAASQQFPIFQSMDGVSL